MKYLMEMFIRAEFEDQPISDQLLENYDYTFGRTVCRFVLLGMTIGTRILAYAFFQVKTRRL